MSRLLLDEQRKPVRILKRGEHKQIANQRVVFIPSDDETTDAVREIFRSFDQGRNIFIIAEHLNIRGIRSAAGGKWNRGKILRILNNEVYTGKRIYNKTWNRLRQGRRGNPRKEWIILKHAFPSIVSDELFERVQKRLAAKEVSDSSKQRNLKKRFLQDLHHYLTARGMGVESAHVFPLTMSCTHTVAEGKQWCFCLTERSWKHEHMLCIGADHSEDTHVHEQYFLIPTTHFGSSGVCVLHENDAEVLQFSITREAMAEKVLEIIRNMTPSACR